MSATEKSAEEEESAASLAADDTIRPHVYARVMGHPPAPPLPARAGTAVAVGSCPRKALAPLPVNQDTSVTGENRVEMRQTSDVPPAVPPRLPSRMCDSVSRSARVPGRPVLYPRSSAEVPKVSCTLNPQLSASDILRSRPPPPPRDLIPDISFSPTEKRVACTTSDFDRISLTSLNASRDPDLVWWPSDEQRSQLSSQVLQLTHWPIPSLPSSSGLDSSSNRPRRLNEYVDSPIASVQSNARTTLDSLDRSPVSHDSRTVQPTSILRHPWPVPQIPVSPPSTKTKTGELETTTCCQQSILCSRCRKCRCKQCTELKPLPRVWIGERECSAQAAVDCCTCMCCARALFYHFRTTEETDYSDNPCACTEQKGCCKRWTALGLLSLCLPCLCLYWPLEGALRLCTACYNVRHSRGCRCTKEMQTSASKGLLLDSESSSSS